MRTRYQPVSETVLLVALLAGSVVPMWGGCADDDEGGRPVPDTGARPPADGGVTDTAGQDVQVPDGALTPEGIPNFQAWAGSAHADRNAEAFRHWDAEGAIPKACARCHSTPGFLDFLGADGTAAGTVEADAPVGTVITCEACHNPVAREKTTATFPSGVEVTDLGRQAVCFQCHQGRESTVSVNEQIAAAGAAADVDAVAPDLRSIYPHYFAAAATRLGDEAGGGFQYDGVRYEGRFAHVEEFDTCTECHDPHSLAVRVDECASCHAGVATVADLRAIRMQSSLANDYDGDGNTDEGIAGEVETLAELLLQGIQRYADEVAGTKIVHAGTFPYFFVDTNGNGTADADETVRDNSYKSWTPRLVKAIYNFLFITKDPGAFAHNAKYAIQLAHDSISDLNQALTTDVALSAADRNDQGHFDGTAEAFRHWDDDGEVEAACSKCHGGAEGFRFFQEFGVSAPVEPSRSGMPCETCHTSFQPVEVLAVDRVTFPGGAVHEDPGSASNLCITCHSGRIGKADIDAAIARGQLRFLNVHYLAAAAVQFGADAHVGYEYPGKTYDGRWPHTVAVDRSNDCTFCHDPASTRHTFRPGDNLQKCRPCHGGAALTAVDQIRLVHTADYDGDGDTTEPLDDEVQTIADALLAQIEATATTSGNPICYNGTAYPYFFKDTNANGTCEPEESVVPNQYASWTPALMKAAHNYQMSQKVVGAWAHNFDYVVQILFDAIEDLGGDVSALTRPSAG